MLSENESKANEKKLIKLEEEEGEKNCELDELELVSWDEKLLLEEHKEKQIRTEMALVESSIIESDKVVTKYTNKMQDLTKEIDDITREIKQV